MRSLLRAALHKPLLLASAFLCVVPLFATVYAELLPSGSFYDSNLRREPSHQADASRLEHALAQTIRDQAPKPFTVTDKPSGSTIQLSVEPASILVVDFRLTGRGATFTMICQFQARLAGTRTLAITQYYQPMKMSFLDPLADEHPKSLGVSPGDGSSRPTYWRYGRLPFLRFFPHEDPGDASSSPGEGLFVVSDTTYGELLRFSAAEHGEAASASSRWLRMLYLSVTDITTLGFGDITPVTTAARTWVAAEALLGVVLVGLFLNALALRASLSRRTGS